MIKDTFELPVNIVLYFSPRCVHPFTYLSLCYVSLFYFNVIYCKIEPFFILASTIFLLCFLCKIENLFSIIPTIFKYSKVLRSIYHFMLKI